MTRKQIEDLLKSKGIEEPTKELIDALLNANGAELDKFKNYKSKEDYDLIVNERDALIQKGENFKDYDELKTYKEKTETDKLNSIRNKAITDYLTEMKVDDKIHSLLADKLGAEFDENNVIKNKDILKSNIETNYKHFIVTNEPGGGNPKNKPPGANDKKTFTKEQIAAMSPDEINKNWNEVSISLKEIK